MVTEELVSESPGHESGPLYGLVSDWAALPRTGLFRASQTSPTVFDPGLNNHLMPAQTSLCCLRSVAPNASCGGVGKPLTVEMTFTPRLAVTASAAIWQSHQENFTCLTFTCLHAVNTAFLLLWTSPSLSDFSGVERREPERPGRKDDVSAGKCPECTSSLVTASVTQQEAPTRPA